MQVSKNTGLFEEQVLPQRNIVEETIPGRDEPYYFGTTSTPIEDEITLYTEDELTDQKIFEICDFLYQPYYKPLIFSNNPEKIYFAMFIGDSRIVHNGAKEGYFNLKFRCNSPYSFSPIYSKSVYISSDEDFTEVEVRNSGVSNILPIIEVQKIGNGEFSIINTTDGGKESKVSFVNDKELIVLDSESGNASTNLTGEVADDSIYNRFNSKYTTLVRGLNRLKIKGKSNIIISYYYKYYS